MWAEWQAELLRQTQMTELIVTEVHLALSDPELRPDTCDRISAEIAERIATLQVLERQILLHHPDDKLLELVSHLRTIWTQLGAAVHARLKTFDLHTRSANRNDPPAS